MNEESEPMTEGGNGAPTMTDVDLRRYTVRIDIGGAPKGTGFFVAPGHVVTCAHVLGDATQGINISDADDVVDYEVVRVADRSRDVDLAVLRIKPSDKHDCVPAVDGQNFDDQFITFGYPEHRREGVASRLVAEGNTGDERLLRLGGGQVQPGMSGAPLLNRRTRGVSGVLSMTRNEQTDLGGYAIPIERLWLLSPTLKRLNEAYHQARIADALPDQTVQRPGARPADAPPDQTVQGHDTRLDDALLAQTVQRPVAERSTTYFVVSVTGDQRNQTVSATVYAKDKGPVVLPDKPAEVHLVLEQVARLFRDWAARGQVAPVGVIRRLFNQGEAVRLLGSILFNAVLPAEIGKRFDWLVSEEDAPVQLALHFDRAMIPTEFVEMPWEYLYLGGPDFRGDAQLAAEDELAFVRVQNPKPKEPASPARRDLAALLVAVTPPGQGGTSAAEDVSAHTCDVVQNLDGFDTQELKMPSAMALMDEVGKGAYDIVHYVGFGQYSEGADQLALGGSPDYVYRDAPTFAALLASMFAARPPEDEDRPRPRVVVLQQIDGPPDLVPPDLSVFAWKLLAKGADAVVAYQFPLPGQLSKAFNKEFYTQLAAGEPFETAVQKARILLWAIEPERHPYLSPAAFIAQPGELRLTAAPRPSAPIARVGVTGAQAGVGVYVPPLNPVGARGR